MHLLSSIIFVLLILTGCLSFAAEPRLVRVGAFNYYPAIFKDKDGLVKGFYVDALADIAQRENIRFEYVYGSWSEGLERIQSGEVDLLTSVAYTPERAMFLDYGKAPLLTVWGELYVPLGSKIDGIQQAQGKKIAVMKGDINAKHFIDLTNRFDITCEFIELPGFDAVFKAVADKKVDAGVVNNTFGVAKQKEYALRSTGVVFNPFDIFFVVGKGNNTDLLMLLDSYLGKWRHQQNSVFNQARQKWSHGTIGTMQVIPRWLTTSLLILAVTSGVAVLFILLLRVQVRRKTADLAAQAADRAKLEETLLFINESGLHHRGADLLADLTAHVGACLGVEYVFVSQLLPGRKDTAKTVGLYAMGAQAQDMEYGISGTPCENIIGKELRFYSNDIRRRFPQDSFLALIEAEGYAAAPLWNSQGTGIGLLSLISKHPLQNQSLVETIVQIVATRAAQELEAMIHLEELKLKNFTIENITDAVYWISADARIWDVNSAACNLLGYSKDELLAMTTPDIDPTYSLSVWQEHWQDLKESGSLRFETSHKAKSGRIFPVEINANFCKYNDIEYNCAMVHDITERKEAEIEKQNLLAQLSQSQKIESVGLLAGGIAHDFNNLLTPILGYSQILKAKMDAENPDVIKIDSIMRAADKARILTQQLLSFGRKQILDMKLIDINDVITSFYEILRRTIPENIEIQLHLTKNEYAVRADRNQLEQIIMNLAVNARDAIADNGIITLETAPVMLDDEYARQHADVQPGRYLMFAVTDSGSGMGQDTLLHIFEPFFTTKGIGKGSGLGLATVYGLVKQHGGHIWVYSEIGKGTAFKIYFPILDAKPVTEVELQTQSLILNASGLTILLVEDNNMVRNLVYDLLIDHGFNVIVEGGPKRAIQASEGQHIDLLLTDVVMPDMTGPELHKHLLKAHPGLKVIYMSGYTNNAIVHHGVLDEGINFIQKPFTANDLSHKIGSVLQ